MLLLILTVQQSHMVLYIKCTFWRFLWIIIGHEKECSFLWLHITDSKLVEFFLKVAYKNGPEQKQDLGFRLWL